MKGGKSKPPKGKKTTAPSEPPPLLDAETLRTQRRVAQLRDKIRHALDDPEKRQQMVEAIRTMMHGEKN
jgi:hypothetical protein